MVGVGKGYNIFVREGKLCSTGSKMSKVLCVKCMNCLKCIKYMKYIKGVKCTIARPSLSYLLQVHLLCSLVILNWVDSHCSPSHLSNPEMSHQTPSQNLCKKRWCTWLHQPPILHQAVCKSKPETQHPLCFWLQWMFLLSIFFFCYMLWKEHGIGKRGVKN